MQVQPNESSCDASHAQQAVSDQGRQGPPAFWPQYEVNAAIVELRGKYAIGLSHGDHPNLTFQVYLQAPVARLLRGHRLWCRGALSLPQKIRQQIRNFRLFVPMISAHTKAKGILVGAYEIDELGELSDLASRSAAQGAGFQAIERELNFPN